MYIRCCHVLIQCITHYLLKIGKIGFNIFLPCVSDISLGLHVPHISLFFLFNLSMGTKLGFIVCLIPPLLNVAINILSSKTYASHFFFGGLFWHGMLKSGLESSGVRFIHDLRCSLHALHDCLLQFLCVRYSLGVSGDYGVTGSPLTPASQASVHVGPADYVLCVIVLFVLGVNTLEFADVYSVIEILCRFFITIFWCLRITSMCLLIH